MSVELKDVTYTYNPGTVYEMHALEHVSMEIPDGQFVGGCWAGRTQPVQ